ncbi:MAG: hypothetical protein KJO69_05875, partial [Gammaproteobacteria bacterium]|nr:hypothetical protein [Gammaproteobacteria bacterium]
TGTNYDTVLADFAGNIVQKLNNAAANTVTVTPGLAATEPCTFMQTGAGATSFVAGTGVTINSLDGNLTLAGQYASATLIPDGLNNYHLLGALIA